VRDDISKLITIWNLKGIKFHTDNAHWGKTLIFSSKRTRVTVKYTYDPITHECLLLTANVFDKQCNVTTPIKANEAYRVEFAVDNL